MLSYLEIESGFIIDNILEKPWPTFNDFRIMIKLTLAILSEGSLNGNFYHGKKSFFLPYMFTTSFSHEAQDIPPNGFLVNIASSS
jgi:hypothetical protein